MFGLLKSRQEGPASFRGFVRERQNKETKLVEISPVRRFQHDETLYDEQYQFEAFDERPGRDLLDILERDGRVLSGPALELGCGTGFLSAGLIASNKYRPLLITDPSDVFVDILRRKLERQGPIPDDVLLGVLNGEALDVLPSGMFTLVTMRSVLHHFTNVESFFAEASRILTPNGTLTFFEPCAEGFILMGALASLLPMLVEGREQRTLSDKQRNSIQLFLDTINFYTRGDLDKSLGEDKHAFRYDYLSELAYRNGFTMRFVPDDTQDDFEKAFLDYLKYCMGFDDELVDLARRYLKPAIDFIESGAKGSRQPSIIGHFICYKIA